MDASFQLPPPSVFDLTVHLNQGDFNQEKIVLENLTTGHTGKHQQRNGAVAATSALILRTSFPKIKPEAIQAGLAVTAIDGRIELISCEPPIIVDVSHNVASAQALIDSLLPVLPGWNPVLVYATSRDKDYKKVLKVLLPHFRKAYFTKYTQNPRGRDAHQLLTAAQQIAQQAELDIQLHETPSPTLALEAALEITRKATLETALATPAPRQLTCIAGSVFIVAELREVARSKSMSMETNQL